MQAWVDLREDAAEWCQGKRWLWRGAVLLYLLYAGVQQLSDPEYGSVFSAITFGLHELGHVVFSPCGEFLMVLGALLSSCKIAATGTTRGTKSYSFWNV